MLDANKIPHLTRAQHPSELGKKSRSYLHTSALFFNIAGAIVSIQKRQQWYARHLKPKMQVFIFSEVFLDIL